MTLELARRITRNTFYFLLSQATLKVVHVVFVVTAARLLGAQGYGEYILVSTMVLITTTVASFGIRPMILRMISREKERTGELLSNVLALRTALAILGYAALMAFVHLMDYAEEVRALVAIGGLAIFFRSLQDVLDASMLAHQKVKLLGALSVLAAFVASTTGVVVLVLGLGLRWLFVTNVCIEAFFVGLTALLISGRIARLAPRISPDILKSLIVSSVPFLLALLLGFMDMKIDILMLSLLKAPIEPDLAIGYYGPAHTILMTVMLLPRSLNQVLVPIVSQKIYVEQALVRQIVENATKVMMLGVSVPVVLVTTLFSEEIVSLLFGQEYRPTAKALAILGWAYGFYAVSLPFHSVLGSSRELRHFLPVLGGTFVLNIALNVILIPRYSYVGSAVGSVVVLGAGFLGRFYVLRKILDVRLGAALPYIKMFLILLGTLAIAYGIRPFVSWLVLAPVVGVVYGTLLYVCQAVERKEWDFLADLFRKKLRLRPDIV